MNGDSEEDVLFLDKFELFLTRINMLKMINIYQARLESINDHYYTISSSPYLPILCLLKSQEISATNIDHQAIFLKDFEGKDDYSAVLDFFIIGGKSCLISHPAPMLFKNPEECEANLKEYSTNLTLPHTNMTDMTQDLDQFNLAPVFLAASGYHTTTPGYTVCPSSITEFEHHKTQIPFICSMKIR